MLIDTYWVRYTIADWIIKIKECHRNVSNTIVLELLQEKTVTHTITNALLNQGIASMALTIFVFEERSANSAKFVTFDVVDSFVENYVQIKIQSY